MRKVIFRTYKSKVFGSMEDGGLNRRACHGIYGNTLLLGGVHSNTDQAEGRVGIVNW